MELQATWFILVVFHTSFAEIILNKEHMVQENNEMCIEMAQNPSFDTKQAIEKTWRVYYNWNIVTEPTCVDITFRNATKAIVSRIHSDMHKYLEVQPPWGANALLINIGSSMTELLLLAGKGDTGYFFGVPNVVRKLRFTPARKSMPLMRLFLKHLYQGKYLLMADCDVGVVSLSTHDRPPFKSEIEDLVAQLDLGPGAHVCLTDKRKQEHAGIIYNN